MSISAGPLGPIRVPGCLAKPAHGSMRELSVAMLRFYLINLCESQNDTIGLMENP